MKYNSKGDDHGAGQERKMSYLVKDGYFLLKLVITIILFSTGPPDNQLLPRNAWSTLLLPENHFSDEKHQNGLIAVLFLMHHVGMVF